MANDKIYVPNYESGNCAYILNNDVIRVYSSRPNYNTTISYKDYYIKSQYIYNEGSTSFGNYTSLPTCINDSRITTDVYYRNDIVYIFIIFIFLAFCGLWLPWRLVMRIFRRWR